ncbi:hypothetical protein PRNP1_006056 [Phytophthora ramorum]
MTITPSVQQEFLDDETKNLICIPCRPNVNTFVGSEAVHNSPARSSVASSHGHAVVQPALLSTTPQTAGPRFNATPESTKGEHWTEDEHERFLLGMELFKTGPWKKVAGVVGTRDARQTMSHAQKYRQKIKRRKQGLQTPPENSRRADHESRATSSTKRMRTAIAVEAADDAHAANRVEVSTRPQQVSPRVQSPREALGESTGVAQGLERATGPIPTQSLHATNAAVNVDSNARTLDRVMVGAGVARVDLLSQQFDTALEPLEIDVAVSVVHESSWLGPDELWDFLDGRQSSASDVVGACAEAESQPRQRNDN